MAPRGTHAVQRTDTAGTATTGGRRRSARLASANGRNERSSQGIGDDILVRVRSLIPGLPPAERRVAEILLDAPERMARATISTLARQANTSETTIVRFCRNVGLKGYPELRIALAEAAARGGGDHADKLSLDIGAKDDLADVVAKIGRADSLAIEETTSALDIGVLGEAVDAVAKAHRIDIYGVGASGHVALDLQQKLHRIGLVASAWPDPHMALTSAVLLGRTDVAIGLSHTGTTMDTVDALELASEAGAKTIAITNYPQSPLAGRADLVLCTAARETTFRTGAMASRIAQLTVVDCLFVGVAQRHFAATRRAVERTHQALSSRRYPLRRRTV